MFGKTIARIDGDFVVFTDGTGMKAIGWEDGADLEPRTYAEVKARDRKRMGKQHRAWLKRLQDQENRSVSCEERTRRRIARQEQAERRRAAMDPMSRLLFETFGGKAENIERQHALFFGAPAVHRCESCGESWCPNAVEIAPAVKPVMGHAKVSVKPGTMRP